MSVIAIFVAFVAVVAVVAVPAFPSIFVPVNVWLADALFKAIAVVPIYKDELPKTALGIVPDKLPAVKLVNPAPDPLNAKAVNVPVDGTYCKLVELVYSVAKLPLV